MKTISRVFVRQLVQILPVVLLAVILLGFPTASFAEDELDSGDTAWMLTSVVLVLFMTIPGLALFYGGFVRSKNVLSVLMQCFALTGLITILWGFFGYSLAFDTSGMVEKTTNLNSFVGGMGKAFLGGIGAETILSGSTIPETVFIMFQLTFAIITPALIAGAFAERMKFSAMLLFSAIWSLVVYAPLCHMAWSGSGSYFGDILGALDFAGGTVVHINVGIAVLVAVLLTSKCVGYPDAPIPPCSLTLTVVCASMSWVVGFGANAGSAVAADGAAGMAMLVILFSTATAAIAWMAVEWIKYGTPSVLGIVTGTAAGLVAITLASGSVGSVGAHCHRICVRCYLFFGGNEPQAEPLLRRFTRCIWRSRDRRDRRLYSDWYLCVRKPRWTRVSRRYDDWEAGRCASA